MKWAMVASQARKMKRKLKKWAQSPGLNEARWGHIHMQIVRIEHRYSTKGYELKQKEKETSSYSTGSDRLHAIITMNVSVRKQENKRMVARWMMSSTKAMDISASQIGLPVQGDAYCELGDNPSLWVYGWNNNDGRGPA